MGCKHQSYVNYKYHFADPKTLAEIKILCGSDKWENKRIGKNQNFLAFYLAEFMWHTQLK